MRAGAQFPPTSEFMPPAPTFNVGTIVGGTAGNILARECEVLWGYRELPDRPLTALGDQAQKWLKDVLLPRMKAKHPAANIETVVRSATVVDDEVLAVPGLRVVARAGVGLDNVDVPAATRRGVMVVNAPTANVVSAAELAIALLLSAARHVARADAALRQGEWARGRFGGVELHEKTLGVVGLGRVACAFVIGVLALNVAVILATGRAPGWLPLKAIAGDRLAPAVIALCAAVLLGLPTHGPGRSWI